MDDIKSILIHEKYLKFYIIYTGCDNDKIIRAFIWFPKQNSLFWWMNPKVIGNQSIVCYNHSWTFQTIPARNMCVMHLLSVCMPRIAIISDIFRWKRALCDDWEIINLIIVTYWIILQCICIVDQFKPPVLLQISFEDD